MTKLTLSRLFEVPVWFPNFHQLQRSHLWRSLCLLLVATIVVEVAFRPPSRRKGNPRRQGSFTGAPELLSKLPASYPLPQWLA